MSDGTYLLAMGFWFILTIAVETPVLVLGLSRRHPLRHRLFAGVWLTACTYPIVWLVIPEFIDPAANRGLYLLVAETFAPAAECLLFWLALGRPEPRGTALLIRDMVAIVAANLASFAIGLVLQEWGVGERFL